MKMSFSTPPILLRAVPTLDAGVTSKSPYKHSFFNSSEDDSPLSSLDFESKNAQRRSRVESLKKIRIDQTASRPLYSANGKQLQHFQLADVGNLYSPGPESFQPMTTPFHLPCFEQVGDGYRPVRCPHPFLPLTTPDPSSTPQRKLDLISQKYAVNSDFFSPYRSPTELAVEFPPPSPSHSVWYNSRRTRTVPAPPLPDRPPDAQIKWSATIPSQNGPSIGHSYPSSTLGDSATSIPITADLVARMQRLSTASTTHSMINADCTMDQFTRVSLPSGTTQEMRSSTAAPRMIQSPFNRVELNSWPLELVGPNRSSRMPHTVPYANRDDVFPTMFDFPTERDFSSPVTVGGEFPPLYSPNWKLPESGTLTTALAHTPGRPITDSDASVTHHMIPSQSTTTNHQSGHCQTTCCLHNPIYSSPPSQTTSPVLVTTTHLVDSMVQTPDRMFVNPAVLDETRVDSHAPRSTTLLDGTTMPCRLNQPTARCFDADASGDMVGDPEAELRMATLQPSVNPIELHFRTLTDSVISGQSEHGTATFESRSTLPTGSISSGIGALIHLPLFPHPWSVFNQDEESSDEDEEVIGNQGIRLRSSRRARGRREFVQIKLIQEMKNEHTATAGYDRDIRIWVLRQWYSFFKRMQKYAATSEDCAEFGPVDPTSGSAYGPDAFEAALDEENLLDSISLASTSISTTGKTDDGASTCSSTQAGRNTHSPSQRGLAGSSAAGAASINGASPRKMPDLERGRRTVFHPQPLLVYRGHEGVVTEVAWSKNLFLLATSMDHQVRLWHISRRECLCLFNHNDTVPTIVFHPKDDRYFLSGSLDGKLRLWNIPDKKVRFWVEVPMPSALPVAGGGGSPFVSGLFKTASTANSSSTPGSKNYNTPKTVITCSTFACDGTKAVVGTYDGRVLFFNSELTYITFITIRSGGSKNRSCRVTAIELDPTDSTKILVTSSDSRLRLVDARDYHTLCTYRGFVNETSRIRASFSPTGRYLISNSENCFYYIWQKSLEVDRISRFSRLRKDRNNCWEAIKAHDTMVTVAVFSPNPNLVLDKQLRRWRAPWSPFTAATIGGGGLQLDRFASSSFLAAQTSDSLGELVVSADCNGCIRVLKKQLPDPQPSVPVGSGGSGSKASRSS